MHTVLMAQQQQRPNNSPIRVAQPYTHTDRVDANDRDAQCSGVVRRIDRDTVYVPLRGATGVLGGDGGGPIVPSDTHVRPMVGHTHAPIVGGFLRPHGPNPHDAALQPAALPAHDTPWSSSVHPRGVWSDGALTTPTLGIIPRAHGAGGHNDGPSPVRGDPGVIGKLPPSALRRLSTNENGNTPPASATSVLLWGSGAGATPPRGDPQGSNGLRHSNTLTPHTAHGIPPGCEDDPSEGAWSLSALRDDNGGNVDEGVVGSIARDASLNPPAATTAGGVGFALGTDSGSTWASPWQ